MIDIAKIIEMLENGGVVAAPTDTIYGLLADATNEEAVERVLAIKGRAKEKGMPIFIAFLEEAKKIAFIDERQKNILKKVWPGKITCILKIREDSGITKNALNADSTIALRIPFHPLILDLLQKIKKPLTATSANKSSLPSCINALCVKEQLKENLPDIIIDGGNLKKNQSSTIVDFTKDIPTIIRKGADFKKLQSIIHSNFGE